MPVLYAGTLDTSRATIVYKQVNIPMPPRHLPKVHQVNVIPPFSSTPSSIFMLFGVFTDLRLVRQATISLGSVDFINNASRVCVFQEDASVTGAAGGFLQRHPLRWDAPDGGVVVPAALVVGGQHTGGTDERISFDIWYTPVRATAKQMRAAAEAVTGGREFRSVQPD